MGRDWTPMEHFVVEQRQIANGHGSLWDFFKNLTMTYNGKTERMHSDEEIALRKQFPLLGKLLMDDFPRLYEALSKINGGIALLSQKDSELADYVESGICEKDSLVVKWFQGALDENFYYADTNNNLFVDAVLQEAEMLSGEQHRLYEAYKNRWYDDHGISEEAVLQFKREYEEDVSAGRFDGSFEAYELEFGYNGGEVYVSFLEFLDNEYQDKNVVADILQSATVRSERCGSSASREAGDLTDVGVSQDDKFDIEF